MSTLQRRPILRIEQRLDKGNSLSANVANTWLTKPRIMPAVNTTIKEFGLQLHPLASVNLVSPCLLSSQSQSDVKLGH
jgi:hypothetical protein